MMKDSTKLEIEACLIRSRAFCKEALNALRSGDLELAHIKTADAYMQSSEAEDYFEWEEDEADDENDDDGFCDCPKC